MLIYREHFFITITVAKEDKNEISRFSIFRAAMNHYPAFSRFTSFGLSSVLDLLPKNGEKNRDLRFLPSTEISHDETRRMTEEDKHPRKV